MPIGFNPITAPLSLIKQVGEQANVSIQSVGSSMAQAASGTLDALMGAVPPLPGAPAAPGRAAARPGNSSSLLPRNLAQVLRQVENVVIPSGLPRISAALAKVPPPAPAAPARPTPPAPPAVATRVRIPERRGI